MADNHAQDEINALKAAASSKAAGKMLQAGVQKEIALNQYASEFARAYNVISAYPGAPQGAYALVFDRRFPVRGHGVKAIEGVDMPLLQRVFESGKVNIGKGEQFALVLEKPVGITLTEWVATKGVRGDNQLQKIMEKLCLAVIALHEKGMVHGCLNPDTILIDIESDRFMITECFSHFCGYLQQPAYEAIDQLACHPAAKGDGDTTADFFALGMVALFLATGVKPFENKMLDEIITIRLEHGSCDVVMQKHLETSGVGISARLYALIKAFLTDNRLDRWGAEEIRKWLNKLEISAPISKVHKLATAEIEFEEGKYVSRKGLAHAMYADWAKAQKNIKISDISRWLNVGCRHPHLAELLDRLYGVPSQQMQPTITDERLARILMIIDPEGPVRYKQFSGHIHGFGSYIAWCYIHDDRKGLQLLANIIGEGMVSHWVDMQHDPREYNFSTLGWSPAKLKQYIKKPTLGFGLERALYELNHYLPCQSGMMHEHYCITLREVVLALENYTGDKKEQDPMDRHIAAFMAAQMHLTEDIRIKTLKNFPHVGKNPQVIALGLLTVAQMEAGLPKLPKLCAWLEGRLSILIDQLHSRGIKREMQGKIRAAVKEESLGALFKHLSDENYARRDLYGFHEARRQYRAIAQQIAYRSKHSNIERMAYNIGLRISVVIAYLVCACAGLYMMIRGG